MLRSWKLLAIIAITWGVYQLWFATPKLADDAFPLSYRVRVFGGDTQGPLPMLLVFHGTGANEDDLLPMLEELRIPLRVVSFRGPLTVGFGAYAWPTDARLYDSIITGTRELLRRYPVRGKPMAFGFSAGGQVVYKLVFREPRLFGKAFVLAGVPEAKVPPQIPDEHGSLYVYHGVNDRVVAIEAVRGFVEQLKAARYTVHWREHEGAHGSTGPMIRTLREDLSAGSEFLPPS